MRDTQEIIDDISWLDCSHEGQTVHIDRAIIRGKEETFTVMMNAYLMKFCSDLEEEEVMETYPDHPQQGRKWYVLRWDGDLYVTDRRFV